MYLRLSPYQEILQGALISLQINEGIIKIIGKNGAGKTALCSQLFQDMQADGQPVVFFLKPPSSALALQNDILDNLKLDPTGNFTRTLSAWLLARSPGSKPLVLIFDDAQQLDAQTFSAIRMLCNIQDQSRGLVRAVLCGNEELDAKLATPALRAVTQFLNQSFTLPYLTQEQVRDFCQGWWQHTGQDMKPLGDKALEKLFNETKGHPGILQARLNQGTTGAEPGERQQAGMPEAPARPYRYRGRKQGWIPALAILAGLVLLGAGAAYLYFMPQRVEADLARAEPVPSPVAASAEPAAQVTLPELQATADAATGLALPQERATDTGPAEVAQAQEPAAIEPEPRPVDSGTADEDEPADVAAAVSPAEADAVTAEAETAEAATLEVEALQETAGQPELAAPAPPASPKAEPAPALPSVDEFIATWTTSWQGQDVDAYLAHYHPDFAPAQGSREEWQQQRRRVISNANGIMITVDAPESTDELEDGARVVRFWLNYSAVNYADRTLKELVLAPVDGAWRILAENNLRTERL